MAPSSKWHRRPEPHSGNMSSNLIGVTRRMDSTAQQRKRVFLVRRVWYGKNIMINWHALALLKWNGSGWYIQRRGARVPWLLELFQNVKYVRRGPGVAMQTNLEASRHWVAEICFDYSSNSCISQRGCWFPVESHKLDYVSSILTSASIKDWHIGNLFLRRLRVSQVR